MGSKYIRNPLVSLERLKFAAITRMSESVMSSLELAQVEDTITQQLIYRLSADVLVEHLVSDTVVVTRPIGVPANWWDKLKLDVWYTDLAHDRIMRWMAKRWPVRYKTQTITASVKFDRYAKFPHATITLPELGSPVIFEQWGEPNWRVE